MLTLCRPQGNLLDQFFNSNMENFWNDPKTLDYTPRADILEQDDKYLINMDMPGLDKKDVKIEVEDGYLVISGERKSEHENKKDGWLKCERSYGKFQRSFNLGGNVDESKIKAEFKNGELTLTLPKAEKAQKKKISIN